jgi:type I restriction enzyme, S subunit
LAFQIHEARNLRHQATDEAEALITAQISALFDDDSYWGHVKDAVSQGKGAVRSGPFGSQLLHEEFTQSGVMAIGTRDVQTNRFQLQGGWFVTPEKFEQVRRYQVFAGDVLCTIVGASIGRFCVVPENIPLAFTTKHIQALTLDSTKAEPRFATLMLNFHRRCRESLFSQVEGSAQPSLNAGKILGTALPLPPLCEQRRIVSELDTFQAEMGALKRLQTETATELDALLPAILDKAFKGEL